MSAVPREPLHVIVAMNDARVIGAKGRLPWHVPEDLKRFKALTMGHAIVMGRKTHESIGRALPGRRNVVITSRELATPGVEVARTLDEALALARTTDPEPFVVGGGEIYALALPRATRLHVTWIHQEVEGDTFFPALDASWREVERTAAQTPGVEFVTYAREGEGEPHAP